MLGLSRLTVAGFRGFRATQEFAFDTPVVLLFGDSRAGKSSTLNAIEWSLFGDECIKLTTTNIRERKDWRLLNDRESIASVSVLFQSAAGPYLITRELQRRGTRTTQRVTVQLPDGTVQHGDDAVAAIPRLATFRFRDFMTVVYQHQENIRDVLVQEPRDRNEAVDRLLGLADYRAIIKGIRDSKLEDKHREMLSKYHVFQFKIATGLDLRARDIQAKRDEGIAAGLTEDQLSEAAAVRQGEELRQKVLAFAKDLGLKEPELSSPRVWEEVAEYRAEVREALTGLWSQAPSVSEQQELILRQRRFTTLQQEYEEQRRHLTKAAASLAAFVAEHGNETHLDTTIVGIESRIGTSQQQLREVDRRLAVINEAITALEGAVAPVESNQCPVCGTTVPNLLDHLKSELTSSVTGESERIQGALQDARGELDVARAHRDQLSDLRARERHALALLGTRRDAIAAALSTSLTDQDDPSALVQRNLDEIASRLTQLNHLVQERRNTLNAVERAVENLALIEEILELQDKKATIEAISQTPEFGRIDTLRDDAANIVATVSAILNHVRDAAREEGWGENQGGRGVHRRVFSKSHRAPRHSQTRRDRRR